MNDSGLVMRPGGVRVDRSRMEAARRLVVVMVIHQELRLAALQFVGDRPIGRGSLFRILPTLPAQLLQRLRALFEGHAIVVALGHDAGHVIHGAGHDGLDALVHGDGIQCHAAPAANADDADALAVDGWVQAEKIHRRAEILGIDVRRGDIARLAAAFSGIGRIERQRDETTLRHGLRIETRRLLLHRAEWTADGERRQPPVGTVFRKVEIGCQGDAVAVLEGDLLVIDVLALGGKPCPIRRKRSELLHWTY